MMTFTAYLGATLAVTVGDVKRMSDFALNDVIDENSNKEPSNDFMQYNELKLCCEASIFESFASL
jgi:hypothetical protein